MLTGAEERSSVDVSDDGLFGLHNSVDTLGGEFSNSVLVTVVGFYSVHSHRLQFWRL